MKILYVTPFLRVPPDFGLAIRDYHLLRNLSKDHRVTLAFVETPEQGAIANWAKEENISLISLGEYPLQTQSRTRFPVLKRLWGRIPGAMARIQPQLLAQTLSLMLSQADYDVVILDTQLIAQVALYLPKFQIPTVGVLLDTYSLYSRRLFEQASWRPYKIVYGIEHLKMLWYEQKIIERFSHLIVVSETDATWVSKHAPHVQVSVIPNGVDTAFYHPSSVTHETPNLIFVGNMAYAPNQDGFFYFVREILPYVHAKYPELVFTAVGLYPSGDMRQLAAQDPRIRVTGQVADVRPYYNSADVVVVPLRFGSGTKLKILEAMSMGVPVVTTNIGLEGIDASPGKHVLCEDSPLQFAQAIIRLLSSPSESARITANARDFVLRYDWQRIVRDLEQTLVQIVGRVRLSPTGGS